MSGPDRTGSDGGASDVDVDLSEALGEEGVFPVVDGNNHERRPLVREGICECSLQVTSIGDILAVPAESIGQLEPPNGFCSMGMPLPGAIAAHMVAPDRKIFAIAGDGDFMMNVQEMETASRMNSDITVMVWEDGGYGLISWSCWSSLKQIPEQTLVALLR